MQKRLTMLDELQLQQYALDIPIIGGVLEEALDAVIQTAMDLPMEPEEQIEASRQMALSELEIDIDD